MGCDQAMFVSDKKPEKVGKSDKLSNKSVWFFFPISQDDFFQKDWKVRLLWLKVWHSLKHKGKYFGQNFQFFPHPQTETCQFLPCFYLPTPVKIFMASSKRRQAPKNFSISNTILRGKSCKWREAPKIFHYFTWNCAKKVEIDVWKGK